MHELPKRDRAIYSNNIWRDIFSPRNEKEKEHGATFPYELIKRIIMLYTSRGELVFDPFLGIGSALKACKITQRNGIGIELNPKFYKYAKEICNQRTIGSYLGKK